MKSSKSLDLNLDSLIANLRQGAEDFCNSRAVVNLSSRDYESAADELERLREERDEARREICELRENEVNRLRSAVRLKNWICFEETEAVPA
jgi:cell division protein FtsB